MTGDVVARVAGPCSVRIQAEGLSAAKASDIQKSTSTNCRKAVKCIKEDTLLFADERKQISFSVSVKMCFYPAYTALEL